MAPVALITGITGQDGSYLAELLLARGYEVHGLLRGDGEGLERIAGIAAGIELHEGDLLDGDSLAAAVSSSAPDEIYNLAAPSFVATSWDDPARTAELAGVAVARLLEVVRTTRPLARFYQASSSEIFGRGSGQPLDESAPLSPRSPYGAAKAYAHLLTAAYRDSYGLFACSGILFNHESPRRGLEYVTRKITWHAAAISLGLAEGLALGDLDAERDWGYAADYVEAMWLMLQRDEPGDFVVATGQAHTVRECVEVAFDEAGLADWERYVTQDPRFTRPADVVRLTGDASRAHRELGWEPSTNFDELIRMMVRSDLALLSTKAQPGA